MRRGSGSEGSRRDRGTVSWREAPDVVDTVGVLASFLGMALVDAFGKANGGEIERKRSRAGDRMRLRGGR